MFVFTSNTRLFWKPKKSLSNQATQSNTVQKNPGIENFIPVTLNPDNPPPPRRDPGNSTCSY